MKLNSLHLLPEPDRTIVESALRLAEARDRYETACDRRSDYDAIAKAKNDILATLKAYRRAARRSSEGVK